MRRPSAARRINRWWRAVSPGFSIPERNRNGFWVNQGRRHQRQTTDIQEGRGRFPCPPVLRSDKKRRFRREPAAPYSGRIGNPLSDQAIIRREAVANSFLLRMGTLRYRLWIRRILMRCADLPLALSGTASYGSLWAHCLLSDSKTRGKCGGVLRKTTEKSP